MRDNRRWALCILAALPVVLCGAPAGAEARIELSIESDGDELAFRPRTLFCRSAMAVRLSFHHAGEIVHDLHNWVLLKPGSLEAFLLEATMQTGESGFVPPHMAHLVLAASPPCALGETVLVDFLAPPPGDYPFLCSIPGHGETMNGVLRVTA